MGNEVPRTLQLDIETSDSWTQLKIDVVFLLEEIYLVMIPSPVRFICAIFDWSSLRNDKK